MSMAVPAIARLFEMIALIEAMLAYELLAGLVATEQRGKICGKAIEAIRLYFSKHIASLSRDRSPGPDVEAIMNQLQQPEFRQLLQNL